MMTTPTHDRWVAYPRRNPGADLRLFCLPYAGGGASAFRPWLSALPSFVELCPIQMPGRENRFTDTPFTRLPPLVRAISQSLYPHLDKPFAFFGHSLGAKLAFEITRLLRREQAPQPLHLFVSGHGAPQRPDPDPPIHALPDAQFLQEVLRYEGLPEEVLAHEELVRHVIPILRADFAVSESYVYTEAPPLGCPITALGGLQDHKVPRDDLGAWREQTTAGFNLLMFQGGHFFLHTERVLVLRELSNELYQLKEKFMRGF